MPILKLLWSYEERTVYEGGYVKYGKVKLI